MNGPFNDYWTASEEDGKLNRVFLMMAPHLQEELIELVKTRCQLAFNAGVRYGTGEMVTRLMERSPVGKEGE